MGRVIVVNGGSSSGKTTLCRALQEVLPGHWVLLGLDTFLWGVPVGLHRDPDGVSFLGTGEIVTGPRYAAMYDAFRRGIAAMVAGGLDVLLDEVLLDGGGGQRAWMRAFADARVDATWVGVRCDAAEAERREVARGDRTTGLARWQCDRVHDGVRYDVEVDSTATPADVLVADVAASLPSGERAR